MGFESLPDYTREPGIEPEDCAGIPVPEGLTMRQTPVPVNVFEALEAELDARKKRENSVSRRNVPSVSVGTHWKDRGG